MSVGATQASAASEGREPVYVWELPVRVVHWVIVTTLIVLSFTGYYLHSPFLDAQAGRDSYTFATVRFVHEVTAFVFTMAVLVRIYWAVVGNRYASWRGLLPLTRNWWRGLFATLRYYVFLRRDPPSQVGHNPLASLTYMFIFALFVVQAVTGFALYAWLLRTGPWPTLFGWVYASFPIQQIRLYHFLLMFVFWAFAIHHVYSSILWDSEQRNGLVASIVVGYKFIARERPSTEAGGAGRSWEWAPWLRGIGRAFSGRRRPKPATPGGPEGQT